MYFYYGFLYQMFCFIIFLFNSFVKRSKSVKFKNAHANNMAGKKVLIIGIGNSAVDMAINLVNEGKYVNSSRHAL